MYAYSEKSIPHFYIVQNKNALSQVEHVEQELYSQKYMFELDQTKVIYMYNSF